MDTDTSTTWEEVSEQDRMDLIGWYNIREEDLDSEDKQQLAQLLGEDRFEAWDCPQCGERCYRGDPDDWGHFQGVCQPDFFTFPGNREKYQPDYLLKMCNDCRSFANVR